MAADPTTKIVGALSLARRAGQLLAGNQRVCEAAAKGAAVVVFLTQDTAAGTAKKVRAACEEFCPVYTIPVNQSDVAPITQKPAGVLAITDRNLATLCQQALEAHKASNEEEPD